MMRKSPSNVRQAGSPGPEFYCVEVSVPKTVCAKGSTEPHTVLEMKKMSQEEYSKMAAVPHTEDYQLRDMLAAGQTPELINVSGMLDSSDPTDLCNVGKADALLDRLADMAPSSSEPVEPVSKPVEPVSPTEPATEPTNN